MPAEAPADHGEKMIEIKVRFWTDKIAEQEGHIVPKHARTSGVVRITRNKPHGIVPNKPVPFNSLLDMGAAIEQGSHGTLTPSLLARRLI